MTPWPNCARKHPDRFAGLRRRAVAHRCRWARSRRPSAPSTSSAPAASRFSPRSPAGRSTSRRSSRCSPPWRSSTGRSGCIRRAPPRCRTIRPSRSRASKCGGASAGPTTPRSPWRGWCSAGLFDRHPNLKIITHHLGGMIPFFDGRVGPGLDVLGAAPRMRTIQDPAVAQAAAPRLFPRLLCRHRDVRRRRARAALRVRILRRRQSRVRDRHAARPDQPAIEALKQLEISDADRRKIFAGNAEKLLRKKAELTGTATLPRPRRCARIAVPSADRSSGECRFSPQVSSFTRVISMNFHLGATKKSLPIAPVNQQADRADSEQRTQLEQSIDVAECADGVSAVQSEFILEFAAVCESAARAARPPRSASSRSRPCCLARGISSHQQKCGRTNRPDIAWADMVMTGGMLPQQHGHAGPHRPLPCSQQDRGRRRSRRDVQSGRLCARGFPRGRRSGRADRAVRRGLVVRGAIGNLRKREIPGRRHKVRCRASTCSSTDHYIVSSACSSPAAVRSTANFATSSSSMAACRAPRPTSRCSPNSTRSIPSVIAAMSISSTTT